MCFKSKANNRKNARRWDEIDSSCCNWWDVWNDFDVCMAQKAQKNTAVRAGSKEENRLKRLFWIFHFIIGLFTFSLCSAKATPKRAAKKRRQRLEELSRGLQIEYCWLKVLKISSLTWLTNVPKVKSFKSFQLSSSTQDPSAASFFFAFVRET